MASIVTSLFVVLWFWTHLPSPAEAGNRSIQFIPGTSTFMGDFLKATGYTFNVTDATYVLPTNHDECSCKNACFTTQCTAWSLADVNGVLECRLTDMGPLDSTPYTMAGSVYAFKTDSVGDYKFDPLGVQYVKLVNPMNLATAKQTCQSIPGHRLLITKTLVQYQYMWDQYGQLTLIDMARVNQNVLNDLVWGDGTPYVSTGAPTVWDTDVAFFVYVMWMRDGLTQIADEPDANTYIGVCQTNPFGVNW